MGGAPPLKSRRHSDADKPKGKRPCKTKHTSLRDREKKKDGALSSPGQPCAAELGASEEDKVRAETRLALIRPSGRWLRRIFRMLVSPSDYAGGEEGEEGGGVGWGRKYVYNV